MAMVVGRCSPSLVLLGALTVLSVGCGARMVPATPSYEADVRPIFLARCVRCHGAGGTLNADLGNVPPPPPGPYLDHFEDRDCAPAQDGGARPDTCQLGAFSTSSIIGEVILASAGSLRMPLSPAPPLDDWQTAVIERWVMDPICSSAPVPDPTICPPGTGP
jgi:hypothetical protein